MDYNRDGRVDIFNITLEFQLADNQIVSGVRFLAFFDVRLHVCTIIVYKVLYSNVLVYRHFHKSDCSLLLT